MRRKILNIICLIIFVVIAVECFTKACNVWGSSREIVEYEEVLFFGDSVAVTYKNDTLTIKYKNDISDAYRVIGLIDKYPPVVDIRKVIIRHEH